MKKTTILAVLSVLFCTLGTAQIKIQSTAAKGGSCSGSIEVSIAGNAGNYQIDLIKKPQNQTLSTTQLRKGSYIFKNLCAGDYSIDVTVNVAGGNPCKLHYNASIASDCGNITIQGLERSIQQPTNCQTANGSLVFRGNDGPKGGAAPYQVTLYGPDGRPITATNPLTWENLSSGNYELRVSDSQSCQGNFPFTLGSTKDAELVTTLQSGVAIDPVCAGQSNGALELAFLPEGATFTWSTGATTNRISNLSAGTYTLTLQSGQCTATRSIQLNDEIYPPISTIADITPLCPGSLNNGTIRLDIAGGSEPYKIDWSNGWGGRINTGLALGSYSVTITDRCGTKKTETYQIIQSTPIVVTSNITSSCPIPPSGSIQVNVSGGTAPYQLNWSTGATSNSITGLAAGDYKLTVLDKNQCKKETTFKVPGSNLSIETVSVQGCEDQNDCGTATAVIKVTGGSPPYTYKWTGPNDFQNQAQNLTNITSPGYYNIVVTDSKQCMQTLDVNIPICNSSEVVFSATHEVYPAGPGGGFPKGAIFTVINTNQSAIYYHWTGPGGFTSNSQNLNPANGPGHYTLTIDGPCPGLTYHKEFDIILCSMALVPTSVNSDCSGDGLASAVLSLKNVNPNDDFKYSIFEGNVKPNSVTQIKQSDGIDFKLENLETGNIKFVVRRETDYCTALVTISILNSNVHPVPRYSYSTVYDRVENYNRIVSCLTETFCGKIRISYVEEPISVDISSSAFTCSGVFSCGTLKQTLPGIIYNKIFVDNGDCYSGDVCVLKSEKQGNYGYSQKLKDRALPIGKADTEVKVIDGQCFETYKCQNTPVATYNIGKAFYRPLPPSEQCGLNNPDFNAKVCLVNLVCGTVNKGIKIDPNGNTKDCCPIALNDTAKHYSLSLPKIQLKDSKWLEPKFVFEKTSVENTGYKETDTLKSTVDHQNTIELKTGTSKIEEIAVYPNPFIDNLTVLIPNFENPKKQTFKIALYTLQGKVVYVSTTSESFISLSIPNLVPGAYFLKVSSAEGALWVRKLIKVP